MTLTNKQKAAMLLMSLDSSTATELLKGLDPEKVKELAVEISYMDAAGFNTAQYSIDTAMEFCISLQQSSGGGSGMNKFLKQMLASSVGKDKAKEIEGEIDELLHKKDPFIPLRSIGANVLTQVLDGEHPQVIAVVLSEVSTKKSSEILAKLSDVSRNAAIGKMTSSESVGMEAKVRIAEMVLRRTNSMRSGDVNVGTAGGNDDKSLRRVGLILRNLDKEIRDGLLGTIREQNEGVFEKVSNLMVTWEDIPLIHERSLQEGLRQVDSSSLALALVKGDEGIVQAVRTNISERAAATLDEEASLMSDPKPKDVEIAREKVVQVFREMNIKGELRFAEGGE